jgi:DNA-binding SARP family transcriptional activator
MTLAQQRGNTLVETTFLLQAGLAAFSTGDLASAVRYCDLGILNGRRYGIRFVEIMCNLWRMIIAGVQQDTEKIKECSQQLSILVEDARVVAQSPNLLQRIALIEGRATAMNFLGRYHAALEFADDAIQLAERSQHDSFAAWAQNEKALALIGLGRFEEALAVARACVELAGEQRMAERTARTALIMAYAGLGKFAEARREADTARAEYNERNPYYLRFALAEARLLKLSIGRAATSADRQSLKTRLAANIAEVLALVESWDAPLLREQIRKEFRDVAPKKNESERRLLLGHENDELVAGRDEIEPTIRLWTFGLLTAEPIAEISLRNGASDSSERGSHFESGSPLKGAGPRREARPREQRDTKARQLISVLVAARAESSDGRGGHRQGGMLTRENIIDRLWPEADVGNILNVLYSTTKRARLLLGSPEAIQLTEEGYSLSPIVSTDCEDVLRHHAESRQARKRTALFSVTFHHEQILQLSERGPFMDGVFGPWLDGLRTRLATLRRAAAVRLIQTDLERGLFDRVEDLAHKLLTIDEFDEEALRGLMLVSARRNQKARLVRLYDEFSKKLKVELRTDPSAELRSLYSSLVDNPEV